MAEVVWRPVDGYESFYRVSNVGDVLSLRTGKIRKPVINRKNGYAYLILSGDNVKETLPVHRIVAKAFVENPFGYECVNHKDEDKLNNDSSNLEWCTKAYNNTYNGKTQRCCKSVVQIDPGDGKETIWTSARKACEAGIANFKNISACCYGRRKTAGGYKWRFLINE